MKKKKGIFSNLGELLKGHFFAGLLVLIPFGVILWITVTVIQAVWSLNDLVPELWQPENLLYDDHLALLLKTGFTLGACVLLAFLISMLGWISKQYLGRKILEFIGEIIQHIPVIRSIYSALDQLLKTVGSGGGQQFSRVVYVEYPRKGVWALAFVTSAAQGQNLPEDCLNIYVPTTPNPTSGFHLIVPESDIRESHMKVEEAFKTILSLGIAQPDTTTRSKN